MPVDSKKVIKRCADTLKQIIDDDSVPRNIRRAADDVRKKLFDESVSLAVRAASAISVLDEVSNDPNIPLHARTLVWGVVSQLETISVDV
jgi:uncharacterized protein (UPF0147 family)